MINELTHLKFIIQHLKFRSAEIKPVNSLRQTLLLNTWTG